jgi:phospholipid-transporting ATPase
MSDDFVRLVETANPAAGGSGSHSGYPPTSNAYGRSNQPNQPSAPTMDPFFDDEDYDAPPDSAFGVRHPPALQSSESGLPFGQRGAPPAGASSMVLNDDAKVKTWNFDDDDPTPVGELPYAGSAAFPGAPTPTERGSTRPPKHRKKFKWPWAKEEELKGERTIGLNDPPSNIDYASNYVSTTKYNLATFVPKFLYGAFTYIHWLHLALIHRFRTVLQIRQPLLPIYCLHSTNSRCLAHEPVHNHRSLGNRTCRFRLQRDSGGPCECSAQWHRP